jgi:hypothetical protein
MVGFTEIKKRKMGCLGLTGANRRRRGAVGLRVENQAIPTNGSIKGDEELSVVWNLY